MASYNMARATNIYRAGPRGKATQAEPSPEARTNITPTDGAEADERLRDLPPLRFGYQSTEGGGEERRDG